MKSATLEEVSTVVSKGTTPTTLGHAFTSKGVPFLRAEDVTGTSVSPNKIAFHISEETNRTLSRSQLQPGDLLITINIAPHPHFKVDGSDLRLDLPITLYEAVLGGKVRVPTLTGAVELSIPKNTSSGRTFRLKGKGLPKATGAPGDLFVTTRIMLPDGNDSELEALMQKWRDGHPYNPRSDLS